MFINTISHTEYGFFLEVGRSAIERSIGSNNPFSTALDSMLDTYDNLVEDYLELHYKGRIAVYGE